MSTISQLPPAAPLTGNELVPIDQTVNGVTTTVAALVSALQGGGGGGYVSLANLAGTATGQGIQLVGFPAGSNPDQATTTKFFANNGSGIWRINDRLFVAGATVNDGAYPNVTQDWLTQFQIAAGLPSGSIDGSWGAILTGPYVGNGAGIGFLSGSQTSPMTNAGTAIGLMGVALNNNSGQGTSAWAIYGEAHALEAAAPYTYACELDIRATVAQAPPSPYGASQSTGLLLAAGAGLSSTGQYSPTCALWINDNTMPFQTGIVIGNQAIAGVSGNVGHAPAVQLAKGHMIQWYASATVLSGNIFSSASQNTAVPQINLQNNGLVIESQATANSMLRVTIIDAAVNYLQIEPSLTGNPVIVATTGTDANIDLQLAPLGTGLVWIGPYTAGSVTPGGYIEVKDSSGTLRKVPCL